MNIFLVEDHPLFARGLCELIDREDDLRVVGIAGSAKAALKSIQEHSIDLVIIDLLLAQGSGLELIEALRTQCSALILVVSSRDERVYAERALNAGARGFVGKGQDPEIVITAIRKVLAGEIFLSPSMNQVLLQRNVGGRQKNNSLDGKCDGQHRCDQGNYLGLTNRELQVFEEIGRGHTTQKIAANLNLSQKTVETYRERLKKKLDVSDLNDLIRRAVLWTEQSE